MKKKLLLLLCMILSIGVLAGWSSPQITVLKMSQQAIQNVTSYEFQTNMAIKKLEMSSLKGTDPMVSMALQILQGTSVEFNGVYQAAPLKMEGTYKIKLGKAVSGLPTDYEIPFVMTQEKVWCKLPNIPQAEFPSTVVNKWIEVDLTQGQTIPVADTALSTALVNDLSNAILTKLDNKFVKLSSVSAAKIPTNLNASQVVQLSVTQKNIDSLTQTVIKNILPDVLKVVQNEKYAPIFQTADPNFQTSLKEVEKELARVKDADIKKGIAELKKSFTIHTFEFTTAVNKNFFPVYERGTMDMTFRDTNSKASFRFAAEMTNTYKNINMPVKFEMNVTDAITLEQFAKLMDQSN